MLPLLNSIAKSGRSHGETGDAAQGSEAANEGKFVWYEWWGMIHLKDYIIMYIYIYDDEWISWIFSKGKKYGRVL